MLKKNLIQVPVLIFMCLLLPGKDIGAQKLTNNQESGRMRIASCQFPVSSDIRENYQWIKAQMIEAKLKKADIIHFPECALSGYPGNIDLRY